MHARHERAPASCSMPDLHIDQDVKQTARATDAKKATVRATRAQRTRSQGGSCQRDDEERPSKRTATPQPVQDRRRNENLRGSDGHAAEQQTDGRSVDPSSPLGLEARPPRRNGYPTHPKAATIARCHRAGLDFDNRLICLQARTAGRHHLAQCKRCRAVTGAAARGCSATPPCIARHHTRSTVSPSASSCAVALGGVGPPIDGRRGRHERRHPRA